MQAKLLFLLFAAFAAASAAEDEEVARIVATKQIINNYVVQGQDITVQYNLYNIGTEPALNVELTEESFPADYFTVKSGLRRVYWPRLAPGANVSHSLIITPQQSVMFNVTQASIRYKASESARGFVVGSAAAGGEIIVHDASAYDRQFSAHTKEWISFGLMTLPSVLLPLALWLRSDRKYTAMLNRSAKKGD